MKINEVMTTSITTCVTDDTLQAAAQAMEDDDCGCLPVVDGDGRPVGIITDRDICLAASTTERPLRELSVVPFMSQEVQTCSAGDDLETAARLMREHKVRRLPVVDEGGRVDGIVSLGDLARSATNGTEEKILATFAEICTPDE